MQHLTSWEPILADPLREQALKTAIETSERFRDPAKVESIAASTVRHPNTPDTWARTSFSNGWLGVAFPLVFFARCFPTQGWERVVFHYLKLVEGATRQSPYTSPGLFSGTTGLAWLLHFLAQTEPQFIPTSKTVTRQVCQQVQVQALLWRKNGDQGPFTEDYDLISGAAGVLTYLIALPSPDEEVQAAIEVLLDYLVWITGIDDERKSARWLILPHRYPPVDFYRQQFPNGHFACGLAHGIAGPLAALSSAWLRGYRVKGQREAVERISCWLQDQAMQDAYGYYWSYGVPWKQTSHISEDLLINRWASRRYTRDAWCYGAPGISRALWLAAKALEEHSLSGFALQAFEGALSRPMQERGIDGPTFCHGVAGLLQICLRFARETGLVLARQQIPLLVEQLLGAFHSTYPFGFRHIERDQPEARGKLVGQSARAPEDTEQELRAGEIDRADWLQGASGIALVLLAAATEISPEWDRVLLIS